MDCCWHLCFEDVEHVSPVASQSVGYPDIHSGPGKPAGPLVYGLEPHQTGGGERWGQKQERSEYTEKLVNLPSKYDVEKKSSCVD